MSHFSNRCKKTLDSVKDIVVLLLYMSKIMRLWVDNILAYLLPI